MKIFLFGVVGVALALPLSAEPLRVRPQTIDRSIQIGYGLAITDVDGDGRVDILLADAKQIVWYRAPAWEKFVMAENLTARDNVCIAAADLDGDGKAEVAVGAGWNPGDTVTSGAIFLLEAPADRTQRWRARQLPHEPTTHRMHWMRDDRGKPFLAVLPLHGRGNKNSDGEGVNFLGYPWPWREGEKPFSIVDASVGLHAAHNFDVMERNGASVAYVAAKEGLRVAGPAYSPGKAQAFLSEASAGEVRIGRTSTGLFAATIEPMHGNRLVVYRPGQGAGGSAAAGAARTVLDENLIQGHALATGDLLGDGTDQIVVGWRGNGRPGDSVGIKLYAPTNATASTWAMHTLIDDGQMACEDLMLADLDDDGRLDIVAAGRATKNVVIYWNESGKVTEK